MARPAVNVTETEFQQQIVELAELLGWRVMHVRRSITGREGGWTTATSVVGWPDLVLWHRSHGILFRELKSNRGKLTSDQHDVLMSLRDAGGDAEVWRPVHWPMIESQLKGGK